MFISTPFVPTQRSLSMHEGWLDTELLRRPPLRFRIENLEAVTEDLNWREGSISYDVCVKGCPQRLV